MAQPDEPAYLIVDGHNIMHAWPDLKKLLGSKSGRSKARSLLTGMLRRYHDCGRERVVLVFDGPHPDSSEERDQGGLQLFHAGGSDSADTIIERLVARYAAKKTIRVATGDLLVGQAAMATGAAWCSPETLLADLTAADQEMTRFLGHWQKSKPYSPL